MPTPEQMESDVRQVLVYCRNYRGPHEDVFSALRERVIEIDQVVEETDEGQRRARVSSMYEDAISTLLLVADPPSRETYEQVLGRIGSIADTPIESVRFSPEPRAEAAIAEQYSYELRDNLLPRRRLTAEQRGTLDYFRAQLEATEGDDSPFGG